MVRDLSLYARVGFSSNDLLEKSYPESFIVVCLFMEWPNSVAIIDFSAQYCR